jgi:chromosome partitioning protein
VVRIVAVANPKTGVGKTATTYSLGAELAQRGKRVLLIDLDPQASLTAFCGVEDTAGASLAEVLGGALPGTVAIWDVLREILPGVYMFLAPSDLALAATELGLTSRMGREIALRRVLGRLTDAFDVGLIDCPPNLGLLTVNALTSAHGVLVPTKPRIVDLRSLWLFLGTLERIKQELNPGLQTIGILVTYFDWRLAHHREAIDVMRAARLPILPVGVARENAAKESAAEPETTSASYLPNDPKAQADLADAVQDWLGKHGASELTSAGPR